MNTLLHAIASITLLTVPCATAQSLLDPAPNDPAHTFPGPGAAAEPNIILAPSDAGKLPALLEEESQPNPPTETRPPSDPTSEKDDKPTTEPSNPAGHPTPPKPPQGLAVRVEKLQSDTGNIDPSQVTLIAPFPAKPLAQATAGWRFETSDQAPPFTREVELSPGHRITLTVRPHLLVPDADGANVFNVPEPGFSPALGYLQNATVSAILTHSIRQLDDDAKTLGTTIDILQQILVSLPKPEPAPQVQPEPQPEIQPATKPPSTRKR